MGEQQKDPNNVNLLPPDLLEVFQQLDTDEKRAGFLLHAIENFQVTANAIKNKLARQGGIVHRSSLCEGKCQLRIEDTTKIHDINGKRICTICYATEQAFESL